MTDPFLRLAGVTKSFKTNTVVHGIDLSFNKGEFISLLGPSGCGKTTVLRMIAGFERPTEGRILVEERDVTDTPPNQRKIGMVFQAYALFPNMDVAGNIGFGLKITGTPRDETRARVADMLRLIGLSGYEKRFPFELSGGQQQRVALARALAPSPRLLLLDEPLSALDAKIRVSLREEIRQIQIDLGITTVFVTHDQEEALSISDRIVVMNAGRIEQVGAPFEVYNQPATRFVATFVGTLNTIEGEIANVADRTVSIDGQLIALDRLPANAAAKQPIALTLRPEVMSLGEGKDITLDGKIEDVNFLGSVIRLKVRLGRNTVSLDVFNDQRTPPPIRNQPVKVGLARADILVLGE